MTVPNQPLPTIGQANSSEDPKTRNVLSELQTILGGNIDLTNLAASLKTLLGADATGRGKAIIPGSETRANAAYGLMPTPDKVTVTVPTDGLVAIAYQATWQESVVGAARAALFLGANQLRIGGSGATTGGTGGPMSLAASVNSPAGAAHDHTLATSGPLGLLSLGTSGIYTGDVTTGQTLGQWSRQDGSYVELEGFLENLASAASIFGGFGGVTYVFAAAGTYDVSVQFKASSGSVSAKSRKLWVWTMGF